jgi:hypothetical protein
LSRESPGVSIELQRALLDPNKQNLKPDDKFLKLLAGVARSNCPSLVSVLFLTSSEVEEDKKQLSQSDLSLQMLRKWAAREEATYGQLCHRLKTVITTLSL